MKVLLSSIMLLASPVFALSLPPIEMAAPIKQIYIPDGFDSNDIPEILVSGSLTNSCQVIGSSKGILDPETNTIRVHVSSFRVERDVCVEMEMPFLVSIKLNHLAPGRYHAVSINNPSIRVEMNVKESTTESRDDFIYLPVEYADISTSQAAPHLQELFLKGRFPKLKQGCMEVDRVLIQYSGNMIIVQPVAKIIEESSCPENHPGSYTLTEPLPFPFSGEALLHVRSINGGSYNKIVNL